MRTPKQSAFTLVELAIVLVIISLIVGGVLVGQDLINAARIRATVSDIEKYNAAAVTFREKYSGLPGDLLNTRAVQFGFNTAADDAARDGTAFHGDGNGRISGCGGQHQLSCELALFWVDLSAAKLIPFHSSLTSIDAVGLGPLTTAEIAGISLPKARLRDTAIIFATTYTDMNSSPTADFRNYFTIGEYYVEGGGGMLRIRDGESHGLTPLEARAIDNKLDDGEPLTGTIFTVTRYPTQPTTAGEPCVNDDGTYRVDPDKGDIDLCSLSIRSSF